MQPKTKKQVAFFIAFIIDFFKNTYMRIKKLFTDFAPPNN